MAASYDEVKKAFEDLARSLDKTVRREQNRIVRIYAEVYDEILQEIRKIYKKYAGKDSGVISNVDKTTVNRLTSIGRQCAQRIGLANNDVQKMLEKNCKEIYGESFFHTAYEIDRQIASAGYSVNWGLIPHSAAEIAALDDYSMLAGSKTFQSAANRSISSVQEIFSKAIIRGDRLEKVRDALISKLGVNRVAADAARYVGSGISSWAMMVARTEMFRAFSLAQSRAEDICEENDLNLDWIWLATLDSRTRPAHGALDGQKKDKEHNGWYSPQVGWVRGPHQSGVASFDINCRCTVMAIYNGEMPAERYERDKGVVPWKTYNEWKKEKTTDFKSAIANAKVKQGSRMPTSDQFYSQMQNIRQASSSIISDTRSQAKFRDYLFNKDNLSGWTKGDGIRKIWGVSWTDDSESFNNYMSRFLKTADNIKLNEITEHGIKYVVTGSFVGNTESDEKFLKVVVQFDFDKQKDDYVREGRIITAYPVDSRRA